MDRDIYTWHERTRKAVMAYSSSCNGWFSQKLVGKPVAPSQEAVYNNGPNRRLLEKLRIWEKERGVSAAVLVSSYVMTQVFPSVPISSFSSVEQLEELVSAGDFSFPPEALDAVREIKKFVS
jgi:aryl-alcohol dehydrogenase-like predicted oxidoreductase